jgi:hypothetical protein
MDKKHDRDCKLAMVTGGAGPAKSAKRQNQKKSEITTYPHREYHS